ncbi:MAG: methyl-accepting chemotaxis protein [Pirellulaceae bacterium]
MNRTTIGTKIYGLLATAMAGLIITSVFSQATLYYVKVTGPVYRDISLGKDLIADILPPPEFIVESYLLAHQIVDEEDSATRLKLIDTFRQQQRVFEERHQFWVENLPIHLRNSVAGTNLLEKSYVPAREFFSLCESEVFPLALNGELDRARELAGSTLQEKYLQHRQAIAECVPMFVQSVADDEITAANSVWWSTAALVLIQIVLAGAIAAMGVAALRAFRRVVTNMRGVADNLSASAMQLTGATNELSSGAQAQAASLEETASSLEEITSTVRQTADNAQQASQLATASREVAANGGEVVESAVKAMAEINQSSKRIAEIIIAIDDIAFQTNLLALNAAVEAARAGEQGRGFAVVAAEVRNLAQRSAAAAKEIKGLIQDSVTKVETGTELVNRSGHTLQQIVDSVKRVTDIVAEIAAASREQSTGIEQVSQAMSQMDSVTQANAAQTEELAATAQGLTDSAHSLTELMTELMNAASKPRRKGKTTSAKSEPSPTEKKPAPKQTTKRTKSPPAAAADPDFDREHSFDSHESMHDLDLVGAGAGSHSPGQLEEF